MAKYFITGVEVPIDETFVLDLAAAHRSLADLKQRLASIERIINQLGTNDDVERYDAQKRTTIFHKERRLVCKAIAEAMSAVYPGKALFIPHREWRSRNFRTYNYAIQNQTIVHK